MCISKELHKLLFSLCDLCRIGFQSMGEKRIYCDRYFCSSCQTRGEIDPVVFIPEKDVIIFIMSRNKGSLQTLLLLN